MGWPGTCSAGVFCQRFAVLSNALFFKQSCFNSNFCPLLKNGHGVARWRETQAEQGCKPSLSAQKIYTWIMVNCPKQELFVFLFVCFLFLDISETSFYHKHIHVLKPMTFCKTTWIFRMIISTLKRKKRKRTTKKETSIAVSKRNSDILKSCYYQEKKNWSVYLKMWTLLMCIYYISECHVFLRMEYIIWNNPPKTSPVNYKCMYPIFQPSVLILRAVSYFKSYFVRHCF